MPAFPGVPRLAVVLIALTFAAACGGGDGGGDGRERPGAGDPKGLCPDKLPLAVGRLPDGFSSNVVKGPAQGNDELKDVQIWHYSGPEAKFIEVFRGGERHKFTKGNPTRALGTIVRIGKIDGGYGAKFRIGRGRCSRYVYEGRGLTEAQMKSLVGSLRRSGAED